MTDLVLYHFIGFDLLTYSKLEISFSVFLFQRLVLNRDNIFPTQTE